jgi:hypothetical protein
MKKITAVIIGNTHHGLMEHSIESTLKNVDCEDVMVFSNKRVVNYGQYFSIKDEFTLEDYNLFCLKCLAPFIKTEFALIIQYDGIAANRAAWNDDFYNYDYIGAPWPDRFSWIKPTEKVGNGGFSLRSAKLLDALKDYQIRIHENSNNAGAEDSVICQAYKSYLSKNYGIKYAPVDLANQFSHEWCNPTGESFGFHGAWNVPLFFDEKTTIDYVFDIPTSYWYNDRYHAFMETCSKRGYQNAMQTLVDKLTAAT